MQKLGGGGLKYSAPKINVYVLIIITCSLFTEKWGSACPPCPPIPPPMWIVHTNVIHELDLQLEEAHDESDRSSVLKHTYGCEASSFLRVVGEIIHVTYERSPSWYPLSLW